MRLALLVLGSLVAVTSSVAADDDYKLPPITRHWRVRVSINESIETHGKTQYEGLDDVLTSNASYSFVVGTTDDDLAGNAYAISQDAQKDLKGVEGTGSYHQKQTFTTAGSSVKKYRMIDGMLDAKNSKTDCLYQNDIWECNVKVAFTGKETWDPNPTGAAPTDYPAGAMATFGGGRGLHQNENWSKAMKLPHDRFTFTTGREVPGRPGSSHSLKASVDIEPLDSVGYEAVIIPDQGYEQWLPEGPPVAPDTHQPNTLGMHVELRDAATHKPSAKSFRVHYALESSRLVGDCMNYPAAGPTPPDKPDLYFEAAKNRGGTVSGDTLALDLADGKGGGAVVVSSRDWGGYGKLTAKVVVSDGAVVSARVEGSGKEQLAIPLDDDGNHIADEWDKSVQGSHSSDADDEKFPSGWAAPGDGYTLFEEYRGFIEADPSGTVVPAKGPKKRHVRFDPNKRDAFIGMAVADSVVSLGLAGIASWSKITTVSVHYIADKSLLATTPGDYPGGQFPRRADVWGDGHPELFGKPQMALWVQSSLNLGGSPAHTDPIRGSAPAPKANFDKYTESYSKVFGSFGDVHGVTLDLASAGKTVNSLICDTNPDCKIPVEADNQEARDDYDDMQRTLGKTLGKAELKKRATWGETNKVELNRRLTQFVFIHELGHAIGMYHHGTLDDSWNEIHGEPTCPMRYWHMHDHFTEISDFVGNKWDLTTAPDGTAWRWCSQNAPEQRLADH